MTRYRLNSPRVPRYVGGHKENCKAVLQPIGGPCDCNEPRINRNEIVEAVDRVGQLRARADNFPSGYLVVSEGEKNALDVMLEIMEHLYHD